MNYYAKNNRKEIVLVALLVVIVGMSLGFAAFSSTLSISSSASVTPNSDDFSVVFSGGETGIYNQLTLNVIGNAKPLDNNYLVSGNVFNAPDIAFFSPGDAVVFPIYAHNVGEYDAYLRGISFTALDSGTYKKCSATTTDDTKATDSLVQAACEGIDVTISIGGNQYDLGSNISGYKLSKGGVEEVQVKIEYKSGSALADGPFKVEISDFKLDYSTVDSVNLVTFIIDGTSYQAEEGMTWGMWINSDYNADNWYVDGGSGAIMRDRAKAGEVDCLMVDNKSVFASDLINESASYYCLRGLL